MHLIGWWVALGLGSLCVCSCESAPTLSAATDLTINVASAREAPEYRSPPDPDCAADREGRYSSFGNRWVRYGDVCIGRVVLNFQALPDPYLGYFIQSDRCPAVERVTGFEIPAKFFEMPVPEQIRLAKAAIVRDVAEFARRCGYSIDPGPFVDDRFDAFYAAFGDGWWFDRVDEGFRLRPLAPKKTR